MTHELHSTTQYISDSLTCNALSDKYYQWDLSTATRILTSIDTMAAVDEHRDIDSRRIGSNCRCPQPRSMLYVYILHNWYPIHSHGILIHIHEFYKFFNLCCQQGIFTLFPWRIPICANTICVKAEQGVACARFEANQR